MVENEHILFQDIPARGKNDIFHSAILTTYAIDLIHFDCHLLNTLHRKQISSINILADCNQIDKAIQYTNYLYINRAGKEYEISSIEARRAFHPKINFFIGYDSVMCLIGSGNLTVTGHGKNHETFTGFMINTKDDRQRPLIEECWRYICSFVTQLGNFEQRRILNEIPNNCIFLNDGYKLEPHTLYKVSDNLQAALLYHDSNSSILKQIEKIIPTHRVECITVLSPYFDRDGATLINLINLCPKAKMEVLIQKTCSRPPSEMDNNPSICFYDFDKTERGKILFEKEYAYTRLAHAKIYVFETDCEKYCIIGSANATKAGLGTMDKRDININEELCVLYVSKDIDFTKVLGIKTHPKNIYDIGSHTSIITHEETTLIKYSVKLRSAWYEAGMVKIHFNQTLPECTHDASVVFNDGENIYPLQNLELQNSIICIQADLGKCFTICHIINNAGEQISNKIFVNQTDELNGTNPSPAIRALNRVFYKIESNGYNGLEVLKMLSEVMWEHPDNHIWGSSKNTNSSGNNKKREDGLPEIKYNPAYNNNEIPTAYTHQGRMASQLITCIEESLRKELLSMEEEIQVEEDGNPETSYQCSPGNNKCITLNKSNACAYSVQASSILQKFKTFIHKRERFCKQNKFFLTQEDLCFFSLVIFSSVEICYLSRFLYNFREIDSHDKSYSQKKLFEKLDYTMENEGATSFIEFAQFCEKYNDINLYNNADFQEKVRQAMKYALLYVMFIFRYAYCYPFIIIKVRKAILTFVRLFGLPDKDSLKQELQPLIERYNHVFEFKDIEQTIRNLKLNW